jgi:rubrerythrin
VENFDSVEDVLDFAIAEEMAAKDFYESLTERAKNPAMRGVFEDFAVEELRHREILENVKSGELVLPKEKIQDMKLAEITDVVAPRPDMSYQDLLVVAMKKEKQAFLLYNLLAKRCDDRKMRETFLMLAQEEAKHKLRFEIEYDDVVLKED